MLIQVEHKSIIGTRDEQQDAYYVTTARDTAFAVVCDGMGGTSGGAAASKTAVDKLRELFDTKDPREPYPDFFLRAVDILDESVVELRKQPGAEGSGTTLVAVVIDKGYLYWLSVGDSRLYFIRGSEIVQVTRDHNYALCLAQWAKDDMQSERQIPGNCRDDALISFIGIGGVKLFDINEKPFTLLPDDKILLTTDGLTKALENGEIMALLEESRFPKRLDALFEKVAEKTKRAQDNTTCVLMFINGVAQDD